MKRVGNHLWKFKGNYAVKGFAAYLIYSNVAQYRHMQSRAFMSWETEAMQIGSIGAHSALFVGLCALI